MIDMADPMKFVKEIAGSSRPELVLRNINSPNDTL